MKGVHIEPFGVYSKKIKSIGELSDGAKVAVPKDPVNFSRALQLFAANNIISNEEFETTKSIQTWLEEEGIEIRHTGLKTGVFADIKGGKPAQTVAIRAGQQ